MASNPKMEYQVILCIFQNNSDMATLHLKEMGKLLWEGRKKVCPVGCLKFSKTIFLVRESLLIKQNECNLIVNSNPV